MYLKISQNMANTFRSVNHLTPNFVDSHPREPFCSRFIDVVLDSIELRALDRDVKYLHIDYPRDWTRFVPPRSASASRYALGMYFPRYASISRRSRAIGRIPRYFRGHALFVHARPRIQFAYGTLQFRIFTVIDPGSKIIHV